MKPLLPIEPILWTGSRQGKPSTYLIGCDSDYEGLLLLINDGQRIRPTNNKEYVFEIRNFIEKASEHFKPLVELPFTEEEAYEIFSLYRSYDSNKKPYDKTKSMHRQALEVFGFKCKEKL